MNEKFSKKINHFWVMVSFFYFVSLIESLVKVEKEGIKVSSQGVKRGIKVSS